MFQVREHAGLARGPLSSVGAALFAPRNTRPRTARATAPRSTVRLHALACVLRWSPALPLYSRVVVNLHLCSAAAPPSERVDLERGVGAQAHPGTKQELRVDRGRPRASLVHGKFIRHLDCVARGFCGRASGLPGDVCFFRTNCSASARTRSFRKSRVFSREEQINNTIARPPVAGRSPNGPTAGPGGSGRGVQLKSHPPRDPFRRPQKQAGRVAAANPAVQGASQDGCKAPRRPRPAPAPRQRRQRGLPKRLPDLRDVVSVQTVWSWEELSVQCR